MSDTPAALTGNAAIDQLAERIARRDTPPELRNPHRFEPPWVRARLAAALAELLPARNSRGLAIRAAMCQGFIEHEALTAAELAAAAGVERIAAGRALADLGAVGLLRSAYEGGKRRRYRLTRFGEDWLLALARCETPPAPPAAAR
jgi:DNA-binding transcriptional ArsR family regulator